MSIARCRCGKTKRFRGHRRNFTCQECREQRQREREAEAVEIACARCGRTQRVPPKRIRECTGYTCGPGRCKAKPDWEIPEPPIGHYQSLGCEVGGGFHEWAALTISIVCWTGRVLALGLFLFWGAVFVEHLQQGFLHSVKALPSVWIWLGYLAHLTFLVGLATLWRWQVAGSILTLLGTLSYFGGLAISEATRGKP